jgi:transcriptional regulator with XRE-family HTH domain
MNGVVAMYGERIREQRKRLGLTMKQLGEKINAAESTVSGYESETRKPDIDTLKKLAKLFGVSTDYLLGETDDPTPPNERREGENLFFREWDKLSPEDRKKALDFARFLRQMAEEENNKE